MTSGPEVHETLLGAISTLILIIGYLLRRAVMRLDQRQDAAEAAQSICTIRLAHIEGMLETLVERRARPRPEKQPGTAVATRAPLTS